MDAVSGPKSEIRALKPAAGPHDVIDWNGPKYYNLIKQMIRRQIYDIA